MAGRLALGQLDRQGDGARPSRSCVPLLAAPVTSGRLLVRFLLHLRRPLTRCTY